MPGTTIRAERHTPFASVQIAHYGFAAATRHLVSNLGTYNLNLAMAPRPPNARAAYSLRWRPGRFERLGAMYMLPPEETVLFRSEAGATTCVVCDLVPAAVSRWLGDAAGWTPDALDGTLDLIEPRIQGLLLRIGEELRHPGFAADAMIELLAGQLAIELSRCRRDRMTRQGDGGRAPAWLKRVEERLADEGAAPSLGELAALCGISVRQLSRGFAAGRGMPIGHYIARLRVERAKRLLGTGANLKAIAHELGFGSVSSFGHAFRRATGGTPSAYRARLVP